MTDLEKKWQGWKREKLKSWIHEGVYLEFPKAKELLKERKEKGYGI